MKRLIICVSLIALILAFSSCIKQRMIIMSDPPQAKVTVNRTSYGETTQEIPFLWYWFYDITLEKEGYKTIEKRERIRAPFYFWMPLDLFWELMPFNVYDTREFFYILEKEEPGEQKR